MKKNFTANDFDTVQFITTGHESQSLLEAKEYLKDIQMTINIGDVSDSLEGFIDEKTLFSIYEESVFSTQSLDFLERVKFITSFEGLDTKKLEEAQLGSTLKSNYAFLQRNLLNQTKEFITAIWDCILLIKMAHAKGETSYLVEAFNEYFAQLTELKTGDAKNYKFHSDSLDMICELVLFLQTYITDYLIFALKADLRFETKDSIKAGNKKFIKIIQKSSKIALRLQMFEQIKSKNYPWLLKLLIDQKNQELKKSAQ